MAQRAGEKSLAEQQLEFKKTLLNQAKTLQSISEARETSSLPAKNYAYEHLTASATIGQRHLNSYLFSIISYLKEKDRQVSLDEIKQFLKLDVANFPELIAAVSNNARISCNLPFLQYKPLFNIRSKQELLEHLKKYSVDVGFDLSCIREIFPKLNLAVQELMNVKQILGFGPKDDTITTIFYNDLVLSVYPDGDIKKLWHGQIIPDEHDLHMQLERAGLKTLEVAQEHSKTNKSNAKRPSTNRSRRIKVTNVHLTDFDFTQEYSGNK